jgi:hypothetical protein
MATKTAVKGTKKGASLEKKVAPAVKNLTIKGVGR